MKIGGSISLYFSSSKTVSIANNAAFAFNVSNIVSTIKISDPPSNNPRVCSAYASTNSSNVTFLCPGSSTDGEIEAVLLVGPKDPATNLLLIISTPLALSSSSISIQAFFANAAASLFNR